jgi:hypothetical protein
VGEVSNSLTSPVSSLTAASEFAALELRMEKYYCNILRQRGKFLENLSFEHDAYRSASRSIVSLHVDRSLCQVKAISGIHSARNSERPLSER